MVTHRDPKKNRVMTLVDLPNRVYFILTVNRCKAPANCDSVHGPQKISMLRKLHVNHCSKIFFILCAFSFSHIIKI